MYFITFFKQIYKKNSFYTKYRQYKFSKLVKVVTWAKHRRLCRVKNMLAMYLKYHKAGLTPTTPVTSIAISCQNVDRTQIAYKFA